MRPLHAPEAPLPPRARRRPTPRAAPRRPRRTKRAARRPSLRSDARHLALLLAVAVGLVVFPPTRAVLASAWGVLREAVAVSRAAEARRSQAAAYAARYGISRELAGDILDAAAAERIDPDLAFRLVRVESEFNERAVSPVGALGLTQLMPATAAGLRPGITREEIFERRTNLRLGFRYLRILLGQYDGDVTEALHAYNRGMGTVARIRAGGGDPANGYADKVLGRRGASPVPGARPADSLALFPGPVPLHEMAPARLPTRR
ncbi:MAG TPA: transglycosylase SLT domain-containing protein [Longimicrobiaceae bacterium]|nr:transglycosylase SLT domain-containing protein [Longimicrobiaceae bacterium]